MRVPIDSSSGLLTASTHSTWTSVRAAGQFSITTLSGLRTAITRSARLFRSSRTQCSSSWISTTVFVLDTPIRFMKSLMASGV